MQKGNGVGGEQNCPTQPPPPSQYSLLSTALASITNSSTQHHHQQQTTVGTVSNHSNQNHHSPSPPPCILLQGPQESDRSSLLMDLAVEMALSAPCKCRAAAATAPPPRSSCICQPVAILRPESQSESFPLFCYRCRRRRRRGVGGGTTSNDTRTSFQEKLQQFTKSNRTPQELEEEDNCWNPHILRKIQVHHFVSFRDCLHLLLSMQGKPLHEQPFRAILIDDVDGLVFSPPVLDEDRTATHANHHHHHHHHHPYESAMQISQFLAILMDTLNFLKERPLVCVSTNSTSNQNNTHFPTDCYMSSFFTSILTIEPMIDSTTMWENMMIACERKEEATATDDIVVTVVSSWIVRGTIEDGKKTREGGNNNNSNEGVVGYCICHKENSCNQRKIHWWSLA